MRCACWLLPITRAITVRNTLRMRTGHHWFPALYESPCSILGRRTSNYVRLSFLPRITQIRLEARIFHSARVPCENKVPCHYIIRPAYPTWSLRNLAALEP